MRDVPVGELESLLANRVGNPKRIQSIIDTKKKGMELSDSDEKFLEDLLGLKITNDTNETEDDDLVITTTNNVDGFKIVEYLDIVSGEAVMGANVFRDFSARVTDIVGGRSGQYENRFREAKRLALDEMEEEAEHYDANAVVGVRVFYEMVGKSMMMVSAFGTAVKLVPENS